MSDSERESPQIELPVLPVLSPDERDQLSQSCDLAELDGVEFWTHTLLPELNREFMVTMQELINVVTTDPHVAKIQGRVKVLEELALMPARNLTVLRSFAAGADITLLELRDQLLAPPAPVTYADLP